MQEIEYEDGTKTKKKFDSFSEALIDAEEKAKKKPIKTLRVTRIIPSKKHRTVAGEKAWNEAFNTLVEKAKEKAYQILGDKSRQKMQERA